MSEHLTERTTNICGVDVRVTSYPVGQRFSCRVDNIDPGTIIGRGMGDTRDQAEHAALQSAQTKLELMDSQAALRRSVAELKQG